MAALAHQPALGFSRACYGTASVSQRRGCCSEAQFVTARLVQVAGVRCEYDRRAGVGGAARVSRGSCEVFCSYGEAAAVEPIAGGVVGDVVNVGEEERAVVILDVGNGGGNGKAGGGSGDDGGAGGGGEGGGDGGGDEEEAKEFGVLLDAEQVARELEGIVLPLDMAEAARTVGIRKLLLSRYIELQGGFLGGFVRSNAMLRNRLLADPSFLFKVFTEIAIDSGCATFAEVQKRGKDFWNEFELYLSDLGVGIVLDIALVGMLAPYVSFHRGAVGGGATARLSRVIQALPSSIFEAQRPGRAFSVQQRVGAFAYKAVQYGVTGFACGVVGQGIASSIMTLKRKYKKSDHEEEVAVPSIVKSALLWGVFMAVSSNTRYQIINGMERVVEGSVLSRRVPQAALAFTVGIRFANNIYGGMQFVDWARLAGVQ